MALGFTSYVVENDEKVASALKRAALTSGDLRTPFAMIAKDFQKSRKAIFTLQSKGQYPDLSIKPFKAWWEKDKKLNRDYPGGYKEYKKAKYGFDYPILKATGRLERSVTNGQDAENVTRILPQYLEMGTRVPYAEYHQSDAARKKLPLRKFLFIGPEGGNEDDPIKGFATRCLNTLNSYVLRQLKKSMKESTGTEPRVKP